MNTIRKALLIPINSKSEILIQDRENYKPPRWGYFGGSIEDGETPAQAVIRETKEELDIDITESELEFIGVFSDIIPTGETVERHAFVYKADLNPSNLNIQEGKAAKYLKASDIITLMEKYSTRADVHIMTTIEKKL